MNVGVLKVRILAELEFYLFRSDCSVDQILSQNVLANDKTALYADCIGLLSYFTKFGFNHL